MKIVEKLRQRVEALLTAPGEELGRWAKFLRFQVQLWRFCFRRLRENNAQAMSSALSFRTVFAMVPVFVLIGLALKTGGALQETKQKLREFIVTQAFSHIAQYQGAATEPSSTSPAAESAAENLANRIDQVVSQAEQKLTLGTIGPVGVLLLIWSAVTLLTAMERSLNRIFGAPRSRSLWRRLMLYWFAVTLGPLALAVAIYLAGRAAGAVVQMPGVSWLLAGVAWAGPVLIGILFVAALYKLMPNTKVGFKAAVGGAVVAVLLWLVAKWAFGLYVASLVGKPTLYGALGLLPLFLIWLNFSWLIFLFGAQLAYTAVNLRSFQSAELAEKILLGPWELLGAAVAVAQPYRKGLGPVAFERIAEQLNLPGEAVQRLVDRLAAEGVLCPVESEEEAYVLGRPAEKILVTEFLGAGGLPGRAPAAGQHPPVAQALSKVRSRTKEALGRMTLADLIADEKED